MARERPRRSILAAAAAALSALTAGCGGKDGGSGTPTPTANTDCPPSLTVSEVDAERIDPDEAVAYETLTAEKRATFDRARNGSVEDFAYDWRDIDVVAHEGSYYRVGVVVC